MRRYGQTILHQILNYISRKPNHDISAFMFMRMRTCVKRATDEFIGNHSLNYHAINKSDEDQPSTDGNKINHLREVNCAPFLYHVYGNSHTKCHRYKLQQAVEKYATSSNKILHSHHETLVILYIVITLFVLIVNSLISCTLFQECIKKTIKLP